MGKEEGFRVNGYGGGVKFFCEKEEKRRLEGCWILWWGSCFLFLLRDSVYSCDRDYRKRLRLWK